MYKSILVLSDGAEIGSGVAGQNAIRSLTYTAAVSSTTDLSPGAACANKIEVVLWVEPGDALRITSGTKLTYYREEAGRRTKVGTFWAVKPTKASRNTYKIFAYDAVSKLDGIQSTWLRSIQGQFPMTLWSFAQKVAAQCGLTIANTSLPRNGSYQVQAFYADDLTGRQLLSWVAQASGTFLRATADGELAFAWYEDRRDIVIGPGAGSGVLLADSTGALLQDAEGYYLEVASGSPTAVPYYEGTLSYEDYVCPVIDKVQIRQSTDDVGVIAPPDETGSNALTIEGNLLLTTSTDEALRPVAESLYTLMLGVTYTPCTVRVPASSGLSAGQIVRVQDVRGRVFDAWIMSATYSGTSVTLECTGNASRDGSAATNEQSFKNLKGKMLEINSSVDGLNVKASELEGQYAELSVTVDGLTSTVAGKIDGQQAQSLIDQALDSITLSVQNGNQSSVLTIRAGSTELSSATITFTGIVNFVTQSQLSTAGQTTINGGNMTTGTILSSTGYTRLDLAAGDFKVGTDSTTFVHIYPSGLDWRGGTDLDGATAHGRIQATDDHLWITSDTRYQMLGWQHESSGQTQCLEIEQVDNAVSVPNRLNVGGVCSVRSLTAWDGKDRVVQTDFWGNRGMAAMESPEPMFFDSGSAEIGADGLCYIETNPIYEETTSATVERRWYVTPTSAGALWVEKQPWGAIVHGEPGASFDWLVGSVQRGFEGVYAEINTDRYPGTSYRPGDGLNDAVLRDTFAPLADDAADYLDETDYYTIFEEALAS